MLSSDNDKLLIATEFGIWSYSISSGSPWTLENGFVVGEIGPGFVPVFEVREDWVRALMCVFVRAEAVTVLGKLYLKFWHDDLCYTLLNPSVCYRWNTQ